jgi:uncharacterized coiled-coil protein SlyX
LKSPIEEPTKLHKKNNHDVRIALLEQSISNINETMIRFEKRFDRIDEKLDKITKNFDDKLQKFELKFEKLENNVISKLESFNNRLWINFYWILGTMFTLSCAGAGILAKGFGWFNSS